MEEGGNRLHFLGDVARDSSFTDIVLSAFDSAKDSNWKYFKYFASAGGASTAEEELGTNPDIGNGVWQTMLSTGLYSDADNAPVMFSLAEALTDKAEETPTVSSQYFIRYHWYYGLLGTQQSDEFAIAVPGNTAVGASPGDVVHKSEFYDLEQTV